MQEAITGAPPDPAAGLAAVRVAGPDRVGFLQGQLTQDVARLTPEQPLMAGWANAKGRLLCVTRMLEWQEAVWLIMPGELAADVAKRLGMFVLRSKVEIEVLPASPATSKKSDKDSVTQCIYNAKYCVTNLGDGTDVGVGELPEPGDISAWRLANIRAGIPVIWQATRESFVPQMVNLDLLDGISFRKGCYVGQEIVARTQNLGRIKRRMYRFRVTATEGPDWGPGTDFTLDGKTILQVVDAQPTDEGIELLGVVRIEDLPLTAGDHSPLRRLELPYAVPEAL